MSAERDIQNLIEQARAAHAKAMNCSDLAQEGAWTAHETVNGLPPNNYWAVTATRTPTAKGVEPFTVWKAHVNTPAMAGLLTFVSTALPQLCDLVERLTAERDEAKAKLQTFVGAVLDIKPESHGGETFIPRGEVYAVACAACPPNQGWDQ